MRTILYAFPVLFLLILAGCGKVTVSQTNKRSGNDILKSEQLEDSLIKLRDNLFREYYLIGFKSDARGLE